VRLHCARLVRAVRRKQLQEGGVGARLALKGRRSRVRAYGRKHARLERGALVPRGEQRPRAGRAWNRDLTAATKPSASCSATPPAHASLGGCASGVGASAAGATAFQQLKATTVPLSAVAPGAGCDPPAQASWRSRRRRAGRCGRC
jgi:hypothetical protein